VSVADPVLQRVLDVARADSRVRAVVLSGSRADANALADPWRDHDVIFVVDDVAPYRANPAWVDVFGERAIMQRPDAMLGAPPRSDGGETWLMLFVDGSRIDLTLLPVASMRTFVHEGPALVVHDPDGVVPAPPPVGAPCFVPEPPTQRAFDDVCNEFWWVAPYVAKGLLRGETTYAHHHLDVVLRDQLLTLLGWEVAAASDGRHGPGKHGRELRWRLPEATWTRLEATYAGADSGTTWDALEAMVDLFDGVARDLAHRYAFEYPERDAERVRRHLGRMRAQATSGKETRLSGRSVDGAARSSQVSATGSRRRPWAGTGWSVVADQRALRATLWAGAVLNVLGVVVMAPLAFGRAVGLIPVDPSPFLAAQLVFTVALFGVVCAWQARRARISRPLVVVTGVGKVGFFTLALAYALAGVVPAGVAVSAVPDLVIGGVLLVLALGRLEED